MMLLQTVRLLVNQVGGGLVLGVRQLLGQEL